MGFKRAVFPFVLINCKIFLCKEKGCGFNKKRFTLIRVNSPIIDHSTLINNLNVFPNKNFSWELAHSTACRKR